MESVFYALMAVLGLGFLVFIHELGHYWIARRQGMRVEAFSIGFGKPIFTWERTGVKWMICLLPFGGYVRIAGMQSEGGVEPNQIADGFYAKRPWQRIKVALAGPLVNILFAFAVFGLLWIAGGRSKSFSEFTTHIGWVDPQSKLYQLGMRPGDVIQSYNNRPFQGFKDLLIASVMKEKSTRIEGYSVDPITGVKTPFDYTLKPYENSISSREKLFTVGISSPASYLIYQKGKGDLSGSSIQGSAIQSGDRILWADGELIFSVAQLSALTNQSTAFLTVQRDGEIFQTKVPRIQLQELKLGPAERAEIGDWQYEEGLKGKLEDLYFIPYVLSPEGIVEARSAFIDPVEQDSSFATCQKCPYFYPLQEGDRILGLDGIPFVSSHQFLRHLQTRRVLVIVDRNPSAVGKISWEKADEQFEQWDRGALSLLIGKIGSATGVAAVEGSLVLLDPIVPKSKNDFMKSSSLGSSYAKEIGEEKKQIEKIRDPIKRSAVLRQFEAAQKKLVLGISLRDREVMYNPDPITQFKTVISDTWRTFSGLFSGALNPKYMSGPVGIVHVVHQSWTVGVKEAFFWMAVISMNLGIVNLLPIPVLDGGHILFSVIEAIRRRPMRSKTMERLILPFVGLLIAFFIYITYQDITRLFSMLMT